MRLLARFRQGKLVHKLFNFFKVTDNVIQDHLLNGRNR